MTTPSTDYDALTEIGGTGLRRYGGVLNEEFERKLYGSKGQKVFAEMSNDAVLGAALFVFETLLGGASWRTEPAGKEPRQLECSDFIDSCFIDTSHTWSDYVAEALSSIRFGWVRHEQCYKKRNGETDDPYTTSNFKDGRLGLSKLAIRGQESLTKWEFGDHDEVLGMWQRPTMGVGELFIPSRKSVAIILRGNKASPEGVSLLRPAYRAWFFKKRLEEVEGIGIERDMAGLPVMEVPPALLKQNATDGDRTALAACELLVQNIRMDERMGVVIPSELDKEGKPTGYKLRLLTTGSRNTAAVQASIVRYEQRMAMTLLAQFLLMGMDKVGSFALAASNTDLFGAACGSILDKIQDETNRKTVADLCRLNGFPQDCWPKRMHGDIESVPLPEIAQFVNQMVGAGVLTPTKDLEDHVRKIASLPEAPEDLGVDTGELALLPDNVVPMVEPVGGKPTAPVPAQPTGEASGAVVFEGLNGAQFDGMLEALERVTLGTLTPEAAVLAISFTGVPDDKARAVVAANKGASPPPTDEAPATGAA